MNRFSSCLWVCAILTWGFNPDASGTVTYTVLAKIGSSPDGYSPNPVVLGTDGNFYGTTQEGGTSNDGTIFQLTPSGTLTTLYSFTGGSDGYGPISPLVEGSDGNFYGTTSEGAADSNGTFFRITTGGTFTTLHTFNGNTEGSSPDQLIKGSDGNFYGTSGGGGGAAGEGGTVVQITMAGAVKVLHAFATATDGGAVNPSLVQGTDGAFYGSTETGGSSGFGTLFRVTSSDAFSVIGNLTSGSDAPMLTTLGEDGFIYGVNMIPQTIFKMTNAGARTTVYTFTRGNDGGNPYTFILGSDGNFYGTAASYGVNGYGTFFQVTSGGTFHELHAFSSSTGSIYGLVQGPGGTIVATSINGGTGAAGAVTEFTTAGVPTTLYNFVAGGSYPVAALLQASDGNFYGTTQSGGTTNDGTLFGISPTGTSVASISFTAASSGSEPNSQLIQDPSTGDLYGSTATGGANDGGTVFGVHAASSSGDGIKTPDFALAYTLFITTASDFGALPAQVQFAVLLAAGVSGSHPGEAKKDFVRASGGASSLPMFYNMCATGAANGKGSFCSYSSDGTQTDLYDLGNQPTDGSGPESPLVTNGGGIAYGTTGFGGANSQGTVFKVTVNSDGSFNSFTTIHAFAGADGSSPGSNNLVLGTDGLIYGTTRSGGANNGGVVFSMTPSGTIKVLHSFLAPGSTGNDGSEPYAGLIQASDGNFYGTTLGGGSNGVGTIYSITPSGTAPSKLTVLHSFDGTDGFQPQAALIQANDGNLYGVTSGGGGGLAGAGVVFKLAAGLPIPKGTTAQTITFGALANQTVGAAPITLGATASSGLAVTYAVTGPATISGSTLTITGVGTVKVTASQAGNSTYAAATPVSQSFTVSKGTQTITFPVIADQSYGEPAFTLPNPPTASSGLAVTIKVLSGPAKITGDTLTFSGVGAVTLAANQAGNASYSAAAQVTTSFNVVKGSQTIAPFAPIATQYKGEPAFAITPPVATSKLPVTVTVQSGNATISGNKVTVTGPGTVVLAANQPGNADYNAAPTVTTSFTVDETKQTISAFATIPTKTYGVAPFTITIPKASSGLPVTVTVLTDNATISGDTVTITGDGTVTLAANQAGNASFAPAAQVTTSFMVNGLPQTISAFPTISAKTFGQAPFTITPPTANSGLPVTVTVKAGSPATISGDTITLTGAGTVTLEANQAGDSTHAAAKQVTTSFTVGKDSQTIAAFDTIGTQSFTKTPIAITPPVASSALPVTLSVKSGPAKVTGDNVTLTGVGTVVLEASQAGNTNYTAATPVTTSFTVTKATQTIAAFGSIADQTYGEAPFAVTTPTASSGLPVTVTVLSGQAKIALGKVTLTGAGTVVLAANQAGNTEYSVAPQVTTSFTVNKESQTISAFKTITAKTTSSAPFTIVPPTATSKLPVVVTVQSGPATISGNKVTLTGMTGTVILVANQAGNANFSAAPPVTTSFPVN